MNKLLITCSSILLATSSVSFADTIYVPSDYEEIQDAVDAAVDGDMVHISAGTYEFDGTGTGTTVYILEKLITLQGATNKDGTPAVTINGVEGSDGSVPQGLGIYGTNGSVHIENIRVVNCYGGLRLYECGAGVTIANCVFESNFVGGGMQDAQATLTKCVFRDNQGITGGIQIDAYSDGYTEISFIDCVIENNSGDFGSYRGIGGVLVADATVSMQGCTVRGNLAWSDNGTAIGGLWIQSGGQVSLSDTTVCGNFGDDTPGPQIIGNYVDKGGNTVADDCPTDCVEDINGDGTVNVSDLLMLIGAWGPCDGCAEDLDNSGEVNISDLLTAIGAWGTCE